MKTFCPCCGGEKWNEFEEWCERCKPHVLQHVEGIPYWRATFSAQKDFKEDCPFQNSTARDRP